MIYDEKQVVMGRGTWFIYFLTKFIAEFDK